MPGRTGAPTTKRTPGRRGRPSSLTPETVQAIVKEILTLGSYADAAIAAGIHPDTFNKWLRTGEKDFDNGKETDYSEFFLKVEKANQQIKGVLRARVLGDRTSKTALAVLERRWPKEWGKTLKVEDATPHRPESPRQKFLDRLSAIEERRTRALESLGEFADKLLDSQLAPEE